jgi:hypothetical protein
MIENRRPSVQNRYLMVACLPWLLLGGCSLSESGPERYEVSGTVTYKGAPVPYGEIVFEPDSKQGNEGPAARAVIENGAYLLKKDKGAVAGPLKVRISGYDGKAPAGGGTMPHGQALFPEYLDQVVQPEDVATHDFTVVKK